MFVILPCNLRLHMIQRQDSSKASSWCGWVYHLLQASTNSLSDADVNFPLVVSDSFRPGGLYSP